MWFIAIGCLLLLLKLAGLTVVATWPWWWIWIPFGLAALWWFIADASGLTKQREADKETARTEARRERHLDNMGLSFKKRRGGSTPGKPRVPTDER
ncbi:TIGR04438 family Trp-rich protein [Aquabacterium sp.]|uniref:TIGR04438 family Trp-rich protein n=1 Tax=Aquabacterium sp. TaxID=1872578 RepID=UPI002B5BFB1B|nr:TIGR04438 family Trp-rich protein [Aquabacterium sp.]HSW04253.1 TIGR04438 family Trp-rich protein [Aquabacterium sp.]